MRKTTSQEQRIKIANGKCEFCNLRAVKTYHVNGDISDDRIENLRAVCQKHFSMKALSKQKSNTKYLHRYGMRLSDMVEKFGGDAGTYMHLHKMGYLKDFIQKKLEIV